MKIRNKSLLAAVLTAMALPLCAATTTTVDRFGISRTLTETEDGFIDSVMSISDNVSINNSDYGWSVGGVEVNALDEVVYQEKLRNVEINMDGGSVLTIAAGPFRNLPISGESKITVTGGEITNLLIGGSDINTALDNYGLGYHASSAGMNGISITVGGDAKVGGIKGAYMLSDDGGYSADKAKMDQFVADHATVQGDVNILIKDEASVGTITGVSDGWGKVTGDVNITIEGGTVGNIHCIGGYPLAGGCSVEGDVSVYLLGGEVTGDIAPSESGDKEAYHANSISLYIGNEAVQYQANVSSVSEFDHIYVAKGSSLNVTKGNIFSSSSHTYTISTLNKEEAVTSTSGKVAIEAPITLNLQASGKLTSGRYMIIDATAAEVDTSNWKSENVKVSGFVDSFDSLIWDGNVLYLNYVNPATDAVMAGNWGVFKSSQAFTGTLWGNRANACVLNKPAAPAAVTTDEKGNTIATTAPAPKGVTLAWGTAYGQSARIGGVGADYSIYGGAIGLEHHFVSGRSLGAALGCDWGTVSPFGSSDIDQKTLHAAVYGRAGIWQLGANSAVAVDWSAAYGDTTSESDLVDGDWTQESLQLDARVSYLRKLNDRTTGSVFAGVQYFAADSDTVDGLEVSSMQNLRAEIGAGISYKLNQKATVYGEASVYNDVMRHNPCVDDGGVCIKGTNPGRTGGSLSVGAQYDLNDDWSVRGGYSFDVAEDSTEHNFNAGAVYKF